MDRASSRIVDANFNRSREALRMMEEYCRFALNSGPLSGRVKQLRHELSAAIATLDAGTLIASRDTLGDVGVGQKVPAQHGRTALTHCFTAAAKRLTEALRVLAETTQPENRPLAATLERLRYDAYTLEKDIVQFASPLERFRPVRLYVILTTNLPADALSLAARCAAAGADCIQLRAKDIPDDRLFALAVEFVEICKDHRVLSILNDRADIAIASGADGVHLGQTDLPIEQVRRLQLTPLIIGKSTHSLAELNRAIPALPTYVSLGPAYPTPTKPDIAAAGIEYIRQGIETLADTGIAHVAIGGITPKNLDPLLRQGIQAVAVCSAVTAAPDPAQACRLLKERITALLGE
jgi:thiamine-phosphate pyrophosphorylase